MVLPVIISNNDTKVYHVTGFNGSSLPDWLEKRRKNQLKRDPEWQQRISLIQDFEFPDSAQCIRQTRDGRHIVATGVYKPQVRVYELEELTIKFERHFESENVTFEVSECSL